MSVFLSEEISKLKTIENHVNEKTLERTHSTRLTKSTGIAKLWAAKARGNTFLRSCILSYIGGFILRQWNRKIGCSICLLKLKQDNQHRNLNVFIKNKNYKNSPKGLQTISPGVLTSLITLETIFMDCINECLPRPNVLVTYLQLTTSVAFPLSTCHPEVRDFFFKTFFQIRIRHQCRLITRRLKQNAAK